MIAGREVHETARQLSQRCWEVRRISTIELSEVYAQLPGAALPALVGESRAGWREYLNLSFAKTSCGSFKQPEVLSRIQDYKPRREGRPGNGHPQTIDRARSDGIRGGGREAKRREWGGRSRARSASGRSWHASGARVTVR